MSKFCFVAPVYAAVADAYTCRRVVIFGALLASVGLFAAGLSSTLTGVVLAYGIFYGWYNFG